MLARVMGAEQSPATECVVITNQLFTALLYYIEEEFLFGIEINSALKYVYMFKLS